MPVVSKQAAAPPKKRVVKRGGNVLDRITPLDEPSLDEGINLNIYGTSGSGKTTFWSTWPGKILAIITSGSGSSGETRSVSKENRKKIQQVVLESSMEVKPLCEWLANKPEFKTVVLDHATGLQDLCLKEILGLEKVPEQLSWGLATQQQYGQVSLQTKENFRALLSLPQNTIIVAQQREFTTEGESSLVQPFIASALSPSTCGWLNAAVDYICQTSIRAKVEEKVTMINGTPLKTLVKTDKMEYVLRTAPAEGIITKFRLPKGHKLPDFIIDPDYEKFIKVVKGI